MSGADNIIYDDGDDDDGLTPGLVISVGGEEAPFLSLLENIFSLL